jgi:serine/threonine-protein kinase
VQAGQQSFEVTYRYFCGQLDSPFSPAAPVTVGN